MNSPDAAALGSALAQIRRLAASGDIRVTQHAQAEMAEEEIQLEEVNFALASGQILEDYPQHRRGPCCLVCGSTESGRPLHVVCTTGGEVLILITVYEPKPPKWVTPFRREMKP